MNKIEKVRCQIPYKPRKYQKHLHQNLKRFNVLIMHRRFGKTVFAVAELITKALQNKMKRPQYAYIAPQLQQSIQIAWNYFKDYTKLLPEVIINETRKELTLPNGALIKLVGAQNPDALRGTYWDGVIIDEVGDMNPDMWESVIRPAISDRGGWVIFLGTPKGKDFLYDLFTKVPDRKNWYREFITVYDSGVFPLTDEEAEEWKRQKGIQHVDSVESIKQDMPPELFKREYECSFEAGNIGAYYADYLNMLAGKGHFSHVSWDPKLPVITAWDLGINDKTCIWFAQQVNNEVHLIDYYENAGEPLAHYAKVVNSKPYTYNIHLLPHDAGHRGQITGKTRIEYLKQLGLKSDAVPKLSVQEGIAAVQALLPTCRFDGRACAMGLKALMQYRSKYDREKDVYMKEPLHDWSSHAADAFRYLAVGLKKIKDGNWSDNLRNMHPNVRAEFLTSDTYDPFG